VCVDEGARGISWRGAPALAWLDVAASRLDFVAAVEVLIGWWRWDSVVSPNVGCPAPSMMVGRIWVDD
jgi:hypothetical protein